MFRIQTGFSQVAQTTSGIFSNISQNFGKIASIALAAISLFAIAFAFFYKRRMTHQATLLKKDENTNNKNPGNGEEVSGNSTTLTTATSQTTASTMSKTHFPKLIPDDIKKAGDLLSQMGETEEDKKKREEEEASSLLIAQLYQQDVDNTSQKYNSTEDTKPPQVIESVDSHPTKVDNLVPLPNDLKQPSPVLLSFKEVDDAYSTIWEKIFTDPSFSVVQTLSDFSLNSEFGQKINTFLQKIKTKFENKYISNDSRIKIGESVETYYANANNGVSDYVIKYRSIVGICNLFVYGAKILDDLKEKEFIGGEDNYENEKGLNIFKKYTGNTVDLDQNLGKDREKALDQAREKIIEFGKIYGLGDNLTAKEVAKKLLNRKLKLPSSSNKSFYRSSNNTDRCNAGIWEWSLNGPCSYFVNVPDFNNIKAVFRLPYLLAELVDKAEHFKEGQHFDEFCNDFFDKGLSLKCYNDKAEVMINFYQLWIAKLEGALSPEEEVRQKIEKGDFGPSLQYNGADYALRNVINDKILLRRFSNELNMKSYSQASFNEWMKLDKTKKKVQAFKEALINQRLWEKSLYRGDEEGGDYFLFDEKTLEVFLRGLHANLLKYDKLG